MGRERGGDSGVPGLAAFAAFFVAISTWPDPSAASRLGAGIVAGMVGMVAGAFIEAMFRRD